MLRRLLNRLFKEGPVPDERAALRAMLTDELTGVPSRPALMERLRVLRTQGVLGAVAMVDLDHFKRINDVHGFDVGDAVLRLVAQRMRESLPANAEMGRMGGEEFLIFLPGLDIAAAERQMQACLDRVREPTGLPGVETLVVTVSAGIVGYVGQNIEEALRAADTALYAAKARGRDRVVAFDDDTRQIVSARRELASVVATLQERNRELHNEARTDALTGLRNRLALDELLDLAVDGLGEPVAAVAFVDVDSFGAFNHGYGDTAGDEALRAVAAALRDHARREDLVFRKGGEELVAIFPGASGEAAYMAGERLRAAVQALAIAHRASSTGPVLTVTVGVASGESGESGPGGLTIRQLLTAASDLAMAAKVKDERNQVHAVHLRAAAAGRSEPG